MNWGLQMHLDIPTVNDRVLPEAFVLAQWETVEKKDPS